MTIVDNGRGFETAATTPGFGILSMQDYCGAVDASIQVESRVGEGTTIHASFPLVKDEAPKAHSIDAMLTEARLFRD